MAKPSVENELHELGVQTVVIPRKGQPGKARQAAEHRRAFRRTVKWRTGCEGRISTLKRRIRLGPHPPRRPRRSPDLDRTRGPRPQPGQDRRAGRLTTNRSTFTRAPNSARTRRQRVLQGEVAMRTIEGRHGPPRLYSSRLRDIFNLDPGRPEDRPAIAALQARSTRLLDAPRTRAAQRDVRHVVRQAAEQAEPEGRLSSCADPCALAATRGSFLSCPPVIVGPHKPVEGG